MSELSHWWGIPLGVFSAFYFFLAILFGLASVTKIFWILVFFIPAWTFALFLVYQLMWVLKTGCILCYAMDLCWFAAGLIALRKKDWRSFSFLPLGIAAGVGAGLISLYVINASSDLRRLPPREELERFKSWLWSQPQLKIPAKTPFVWSSDSPKKIQIVEFSDFQCPHCRSAALSTTPYLKAQRDVELWVFPYPIDSKCHPDLQGRPARQSCDWTRVAICAQKQNQFWNVYERIYELAQSSRPIVDDQNMEKLSLDQSVLKACLSSEETDRILKDLIDTGRELQIAGTPTFFIDGYRLPSGLGNPIYKILLDDIRSRRR